MGFFSNLFGKKEPAQAVVSAQPVPPESLPATFPNVLRIEEVFQIAPKPLEVGLKRSKLYKDRYVARGTVTDGSFTKDELVIVTTGAGPFQCALLDVIPVDASDFQTELAANMHKKTAAAGTAAWLILDITDAPKTDSVIGKL